MNKATKIALVTGEIKDCMSAARTRAVHKNRTHANRRRRDARSQSEASAWARAETRCDLLVLQRNRQRARVRKEKREKKKEIRPVRTASSRLEVTYCIALMKINPVNKNKTKHVRFDVEEIELSKYPKSDQELSLINSSVQSAQCCRDVL